MSVKNLNSKKKEELVEMVSNLQEQLKEKPAVVSPKKSDENDTLLQRIADLEEQLGKAKQTEKFVGVELISMGRVWLPAPESRSGRPEDANKGRLMKKQGEIALIPTYWMLDYIANDISCFRWGEVRINNERAKAISPQLNIIDIDIPEKWLENSLTEEEILLLALDRKVDFYDVIAKHKEKYYLLSRIQGVLEAKMDTVPRESPIIPLLTGYSDHIDTILNPEPKQIEKKDK
jgi:hypothetical protein